MKFVSISARAVAIIALFLVPLLVRGFLPATHALAEIELAVDTAIINQDGVLGIYGSIRQGGEKGLPVGAGDINGDGRADVIFCAMYADAGPGFRSNNGQASFYISDGRDSGAVDTALFPANVFHLIGANAGDLLGTSVSTGDVNGDGFHDVVIGAFGDDGQANQRTNSGAAYLVLGSAEFNMRADLSTLDGNPPPGVIAIYGSQPGGRAGIWADIGDVDGDGFGDIVIGSDQLNSPQGEAHVGGAEIVFGGPNLPQVIDLAQPPAGVRTARVFGASTEDHWGAALQARDINDDGIADLIIGGSIFRDSASYVSPGDEDSGHDARGADFGGLRNRCGEAFVVYGTETWPASIDLSNPPATATHVIGAQENDLLGSQLHSGDLNGDGRTDLILGALQANAPDNKGNTGAVYIAYGSPQLVGATIDLANPSASGVYVTTIYGQARFDCAGDSVRSFDINNDGKWELFIGSPEHTFALNGEIRNDAGDTKFIFGRSELLPPVIKLYALEDGFKVYRLAGAHGAQQGTEGGDEFSYRLAGGDVDGDGFVDYIANAMHGDGLFNGHVDAGNVYVFSGKKLSQKLGMLTPVPDPAPVLTSATLRNAQGQTVTQANAGANGLQVIVSGTGFRVDTEVRINGVVAVAQPFTDTGTRVINLDNNPAMRNTAGPLAVRVRNTQPASVFSNEIVAGTLVGPEISSIRPKRKSSGILILNISGANFLPGMTVSVTTASQQPVAIKNVTFEASDALKVKIKASQAPPPGTGLRVQVVGLGGVVSNEFAVTAP